MATADDDHGFVDVIDTREAYLEAVDAIAKGHGPISIDAERASGYRYSQRAYLIQIFRRGSGVFLFDPPAIGSMSELNDVIRDDEWILHAASQDLACLREVGLDPTRIFDTELGARLAGMPRVGLGAVVEELLGIHLAKEHSAADWSTRPLPQSWLVYAALDVELLVDLRDAMYELLDGQEKIEIAEEEFEATLHRDAKPPRQEPWRRTSGLSTLRGQRALGLVRELWEARDAYAIEVDTSPGRLLPDSSIIAAVRGNAQTKRDLGAQKDFVGRASRTELARWWAALERGRASSDLPSLRGPSTDTLPPPRSWIDRAPEADARYKAARPKMQHMSEAMSIPVENLLTPDHLRRVAWDMPAVLDVEHIGAALRDAGAREWQIRVTAPAITQAFVEAGQSLRDGADDPS
ncbi:ribonuclease D [Frondihabitans sp. PAMC 28766]|uniref:HRDC domain-containing protein n=1 Tax=Frondihabitans sp. PAMC 28766 TaxID=1795630 RepID=UPI00078EC8CD|nr:ribonuclease D [Frondihabitans sp. PAMC 28766]